MPESKVIELLATLNLSEESVAGLATLLSALGKLTEEQRQRVCWAAIGMAAVQATA